MDKVLIAVSLGIGAAIGFAIGYYTATNNQANSPDKEYVDPVYEEKTEKSDKTSKPDFMEDISEKASKIVSAPGRLAMPGENGINYSAYVKDLKYKQETQAPPDDDPDEEIDELEDEIDPDDYEETYEERLERESEEMAAQMEEYKKEHAGKIELMEADEWDTDFPETDYEREDLYYFTESELLTDEDGNVLDEPLTIGKKVRQIGWMQSPDDVIYVRNHPNEKEYRVFKERCTVEDWF